MWNEHPSLLCIMLLLGQVVLGYIFKKERKGKERKGKERKGKERKNGRERKKGKIKQVEQVMKSTKGNSSPSWH